MSDLADAMLDEFQTGAEALQENAKSGVQFDKTHFLRIEKDGERAIIRLLTDADRWITVQQHQMVPTKSAPKDAKNWPKSMSAVCRYSKKADKVTPFFGDCYICDKMRTSEGKKFAAGGRGWALAVLREEVIEDGRRVGYKDATREVQPVDADGKPKGDPIHERAIVVVNMAWKNFFSPLQGFAAHYGTVLDRDYIIKRKGTGTDTDYDIIPEDPIPGHDMRDPAMLARYVPEGTEDPKMFLQRKLAGEIADRMSDDYYDRFFNREAATPATPSAGSNGAPAPDKPATDADPESLAALRQRVTGYGPGGAEEAQTPPPAPPAPEAPAQAPPGAAPASAAPAASGGAMRDFG